MTAAARPPDAQGDLNRFPIPRLLFFLLKKSFLGQVEVVSQSLRGRIYLRDGMPVFTDIISTRDYLGRILVERGAINEQTFNTSLQQLATARQLHGQVLLQMGAIDQRTLVDALRLQLHRKLNRLFTLDAAQISLYSEEHPYGLEGEGALVQADPLRVIYQGVRNCLDHLRMAPELDKLQGHIFRLRPGFERRQARYGMSEDELALVSFLTGSAVSVEGVLRVSHLPPLQTLMVIYTLWVTEALAATPDAAVARAPAPAPRAPSAELPPVPREGSAPRAEVPPLARVPSAELRAQHLREGSSPRAEARAPSAELPPVPREGSAPRAEVPPLARVPSAELRAQHLREGSSPRAEARAPLHASSSSIPGFEDLARAFTQDMTGPSLPRADALDVTGPSLPRFDADTTSPSLPRAFDGETTATEGATPLIPTIDLPGSGSSPVIIAPPPVMITPPPPELGPAPIAPPAGLGPIIMGPEPSPTPVITPPPPSGPIIMPPPDALDVTGPSLPRFNLEMTGPSLPQAIAPPAPAGYDVPDRPRRASRESQPAARPPAGPGVARVPSSPGAALPRVPSSPGATLPRMPSSPGLPRVPGGREASDPGRPSRPTGQTPAVPSTQAVMEHKTLLKKTRERIKDQHHYDVLEIKRDATADQVRDAYFRLAKIYHPDRCAALGLSDMNAVAEEIFRRINEAHTVLTDEAQRKAYDEELEGAPSRKEAQNALEAEFTFQKGVIFFRKKNFAEAVKCFEESWRLNDKEGEHLAWLAWTIFSDPKSNRQAVLPKAKERLLQSIKISPQNPVCHYYLGEVYLALGDEKRARTCFQKTVEIQEGHVEANRHLRLMSMRKEKEESKGKGLFGLKLGKKK